MKEYGRGEKKTENRAKRSDDIEIAGFIRREPVKYYSEEELKYTRIRHGKIERFVEDEDGDYSGTDSGIYRGSSPGRDFSRDRENQGKTTKVKEKRKRKKIAGKIVLALLFVLAVVIGGFAGKFSYALKESLDHLDRSSSVDLSTLEVSEQWEKDEEIINILLVGSDKRRGWAETGRSDSAMIATLDTRHNQLKLTSLMRDMYLPIPGHGENRFNASYSYGGVELLYETIGENFSMAMDGYAVVDFATFREVIDEIGGVEITLTDAEYDYLIGAYPQKKKIQQLKRGKNCMNGTQALAYCRIRQDAQGDFGRTKRQRNVLEAIFKKAKSLSMSELTELAEKILPNIATDLTNEEIISYMKTILFMGTTTINQFRLPVDGSYTPQMIYGMDVLVIDIEANKKALFDFIHEES